MVSLVRKGTSRKPGRSGTAGRVPVSMKMRLELS
jgi:hypothetical protein